MCCSSGEQTLTQAAGPAAVRRELAGAPRRLDVLGVDDHRPSQPARHVQRRPDRADDDGVDVVGVRAQPAPHRRVRLHGQEDRRPARERAEVGQVAPPRLRQAHRGHPRRRQLIELRLGGRLGEQQAHAVPRRERPEEVEVADLAAAVERQHLVLRDHRKVQGPRRGGGLGSGRHAALPDGRRQDPRPRSRLS
jgi:hypothetical protein